MVGPREGDDKGETVGTAAGAGEQEARIKVEIRRMAMRFRM
jgi:hypothetical protein